MNSLFSENFLLIFLKLANHLSTKFRAWRRSLTSSFRFTKLPFYFLILRENQFKNLVLFSSVWISTPIFQEWIYCFYFLRKNKITGCRFLGAHIEGPFISEQKKGAHPIQNIRSDLGDDPVATLLEMYGSIENIAIVGFFHISDILFCVPLDDFTTSVSVKTW